MKAPRKGKLRAVPDTPDIPPPVEGWAQVSGEPVVWTGGFTTSGRETPEGELVEFDYGGKTRAQEATDSVAMLALVIATVLAAAVGILAIVLALVIL